MNRVNRAIVPGGGVVVLALAVWGASFLPVQQPSSSVTIEDDRARVAVVCPTITGTADQTAVAAGSAQGGLATADLDAPDRSTSASQNLIISTQPRGPILVSAPRLDVFSGSTRTAAPQGSERGLSMMSCDRPATSQWFVGVASSEAGTAEVVLLNADAQDAVVDIAVQGAEGRVNAPGSRGIIVAAHSRRVVPLGPLFTTERPVALHVTSSAGRVAAAVRQRMFSGDSPAGSEWLPPTAEPATAVIIPGLPSGKGSRDLVVVNPGDRTASVALQVLGADGPTAVPGFETLDLPPGTSRSIPLGSALAQAAVALRLSSEQKITAAVISSSGSDATTTDVSTQIATTALTGPGVLALAPGAQVTPTLHLTNNTTDPIQVRVSVSDARGQRLLGSTVSVPGLANSAVPLPKAENVLVGVEPVIPGTVHVSVAVRVDLQGLAGVASLALLPGAAAAMVLPIRHDVRVGS